MFKRFVSTFATVSLLTTVFLVNVPIAYAATVTWDGDNVTKDWCIAENWDGDTLPTNADDVVIDAVVTVTTMMCAPGELEFNSLTIGGVNATTILLDEVADFGTVGNLTVANNGTIQHDTDDTFIIDGTLLVESGGTITHEDNSTTQQFTVSWEAANIDVQFGGSIDVDGLGYDPSYGLGAGGNGTYSGGGAHGGNGGNGKNGSPIGGTSYCDITNPNTIGSGAGNPGGSGGGLIDLVATNTLTINGSLSADGQDGSIFTGGGAGGSIKLEADTISGVPQDLSFNGGFGFGNVNGYGGGGGGGCGLISYATSSTITTATMNGGTAGSSQPGGAGQLLVIDSDSGNDGDLYVQNTVSGAVSTQGKTSLNVGSINLSGSVEYVIPLGRDLTVTGLTPYGGDGSGEITVGGVLTSSSNHEIDNLIVDVSSGGEYISSSASTIDITDDGGLKLNAGSEVTTSTDNNISTLTSNGTLWLDQSAIFTITDLLIEAGTTTLYNYTTADALTISGSVDMTGGILTHAANDDAQTHIINIDAPFVTIDVGASVDADGKGYSSGEGPGAGGGAVYSGGGAHGGDGGNGRYGASTPGGGAYCDVNDITTIGSAAGGSTGGAGGGLIYLNVTDTLTFNGTITASGNDGPLFLGGGGGGGIKIVTDSLSGTTGAISAAGGAGTGNVNGYGGGGGGGCVYLSYASASFAPAVNVAGGTTGLIHSAEVGDIGLYVSEVSNTAPTVSTALATTGQDTDGSGLYNFTFSLDDDDDDTLSVQVECGDAGYADIDISSVTVASGILDNDAATYQISGMDTSSGPVDVSMKVATQSTLDDLDTSTFQCRVTPYDGTSTGTASELTGLSLDNLDPDPNADASISFVSDADSNGIVNIGDTFVLNAGTENTGDTITWSLNAVGLTSNVTLNAGVTSTPIIAGELDLPEDNPTNVTVTDDAGNSASGAYVTTVPATDNEPATVNTGAITLAISNDADSSGTMTSGDTLLLTWDNTIDANTDEETVTADLSSLNLSASLTLNDDGINGDAAAGDDIYSRSISVPDSDGETYSDTFTVSVIDDANNSNTGTSSSYTVSFDQESNNDSGGGNGSRDNPLTSGDDDSGDDDGGDDDNGGEDEESYDEEYYEDDDYDDESSGDEDTSGEEDTKTDFEITDDGGDDPYIPDEDGYQPPDTDNDYDVDPESDSNGDDENDGGNEDYHGASATNSSSNSKKENRLEVDILDQPDEDAVEVPVAEQDLTEKDPLFTNTKEETQFGVFGMSKERSLCTGQKVVVTGKIKGNEIGCRITQSSNSFTQRKIENTGPIDCSEHVVLDNTGTFLLETSDLDVGNNSVEVFTRKEVANFDICVEEVGSPNPLSLAYIKIGNNTNFVKVGKNHYKLVDTVLLDDPNNLDAVAELKDAIISDQFYVQGIWNSLIMSSVVLADSRADQITVKPPQTLDEGEHTLYLKTVDTEANRTSDTVRIDFELDYTRGSASENPFAMNTIYVGLIAILTSTLGYLIYRRKYYSV